MAESSWIKDIQFEEPHTLHVYTHSGKHYVHAGVSRKVYDGFDSAKSKGQYFNQHIAKNHPGKLA